MSMNNKCRDCEFCFPHEEFGYVCAGENYGENISATLNDNKPCYSEGLDAFIKRSKREEIIYMPNTKLGQLKIDGRKQIELTDIEGKTIRVKASKAKEFFGEVPLIKNRFDDEYLVDVLFNNEMFKGSRYLIIK